MPRSAREKERVAITIPDEHQLAAARLSFKAKGTTKPKVKVSLANAGELHPDIVVASQVAREKAKKKKGKGKKKGRAVVLLALGNVPGAGAAAAERDRRIVTTGTDNQAIVEVASASSAISSLKFEDLPNRSRTFLSVLGAEPAAEHQLAQETFHLNGSAVDDVQYTVDGLSLRSLSTPMDLKLINAPEVLTGGPQAVEPNPDAAIASAIAAALGPPLPVDADTYGFFSGSPVPLKVTGSYAPSPSNPSVLFNFVSYSTKVSGAQVTADDAYPLQFNSNARCSTGNSQFGIVVRLGEDAACRLPAFDEELFFDLPFGMPVPEGAEAGFLLPIPRYRGAPPNDDDFGEALIGRRVAAVIG